MKHLETNKILTESQHGFRKSHSCESQLLLTVEDLASSLNKNQQVDAILLDFSKAFDKVPHQRLLAKIKHYGIRDNLNNWISDFLGEQKQEVVLEGKHSTSSNVTSGVPQGTVLGPLLFFLFINDMPENILSTARLFADDCLLYRTINSIEDAKELQKDLDTLQRWEQTWLMEFNPDKCEVINIINKRSHVYHDYNIHGKMLAHVTHAKYLGLTFSTNMTWDKHIDIITKKANSTCAFLRRNISSCSTKVKAQCYTTLVRPNVEYAATIWDPYTKQNIDKLEQVQRRAARFVNGDYSTYNSVSKMIKDLNWPSLQQRRQNMKVIMMYRIVYNLIAIPSQVYLTPVITTTTRGHSMRFIVPHSRIKIHQYSFFPSAIRLWNTLPDTLVVLPTLEAFKAGIQLAE